MYDDGYMLNKYLQKPEKIYVHENDLPDWVQKGKLVAIDTEAMGLKIGRDRLCLVQLTFDGSECHLVQFSSTSNYYGAKNLINILEDPAITKIFHFARFDVAILFDAFGILTQNIYCTKIASKLTRTYTERHGLKTICSELLGVEISKKEQSSDWGKKALSDEQKVYAAMDVLYLHVLKEKFDEILERECRMPIAQECFKFLPYLAQLDCLGWSESIFAHI